MTLGGSLGTHCRFLYGHCLAMVEMLTVAGQFLTLLVDIGDEKGFDGLN